MLFDVEAFVGQRRERRMTPHFAINRVVSKTGKIRTTAIDGRKIRPCFDKRSSAAC